jgi:hypothetical protein
LNTTSALRIPTKQPTLEEAISGKGTIKTQSQLDDHILKYIVKSMSPLGTVECTAFKELISGKIFHHRIQLAIRGGVPNS